MGSSDIRRPGRAPTFSEEKEIRFKAGSISLPEPLWLKLEAQRKRWMDPSLSATIRRILMEWLKANPTAREEA